MENVLGGSELGTRKGELLLLCLDCILRQSVGATYVSRTVCTNMQNELVLKNTVLLYTRVAIVQISLRRQQLRSSRRKQERRRCIVMHDLFAFDE
jgi:hypothetical protein